MTIRCYCYCTPRNATLVRLTFVSCEVALRTPQPSTTTTALGLLWGFAEQSIFSLTV
jgi:hypothetical protein